MVKYSPAKPLFLAYEISNPQGGRMPYDPNAPVEFNSLVRRCICESRNYDGSAPDAKLGRHCLKRFSVWNGDAEALRVYYKKRQNFGGRSLPRIDRTEFDHVRVAVGRIDDDYPALFRAAAAMLRRYERSQEEAALFAATDDCESFAGLLGVPAADILDLRSGREDSP